MSDLLGSRDIFYTRNFGCFRPKTTFSTPTRFITNCPNYVSPIAIASSRFAMSFTRLKF
jgi:hypothetical protein